MLRTDPLKISPSPPMSTPRITFSESFGQFLKQFPWPHHRNKGIELADKTMIAKMWANYVARQTYNTRCQHILWAMVPVMQQLVGKPVVMRDYSDNGILLGQVRKYERDLKWAADHGAALEREPLTESEDEDENDVEEEDADQYKWVVVVFSPL
ncbi:unnamed protein product [Cuscuta europaea]|uniref:Uncharacterized protein n=1 Tax=Cuscuta europaea TaxID=41803 RepID=A0A9P0Z3I1_CUSEU|nr:unnamed protein product [Cuscuta europaea]